MATKAKTFSVTIKVSITSSIDLKAKDINDLIEQLKHVYPNEVAKPLGDYIDGEVIAIQSIYNEDGIIQK